MVEVWEAPWRWVGRQRATKSAVFCRTPDEADELERAAQLDLRVATPSLSIVSACETYIGLASAHHSTR